jgi:tetratricopeptide (TPR) repeat protein
MSAISENLSKCKNVRALLRLTEHAFSPHEIKKIQQMGLKHFQNQHIDQAHLYFTFLTMIDSENASIWLAKGMAEQSLEKFEEALVSYSNALTLLPQGIVTYIQIIETLILMKKIEQAQQVYDIFVKEIDQNLFAHDEFLVSKVNGVKEFLSHLVS